MNKKLKTQKELYLKIPYRILNITKLGIHEKVLLAHIYSFGEKGCWQSNKTIAEMFMTTERTIRRWINNISRYLYIKNPKGYYRTIYAKSHPPIKGQMDKIGQEHGQKASFDLAKNGHRHGQKCPTTNINTIKENNIKTTATPSPQPAKGAPALLVERDKEADAAVKNFIASFGKKKKKYQPMSQAEFDRRKAAQLKALSAVGGPNQSAAEKR